MSWFKKKDKLSSNPLQDAIIELAKNQSQKNIIAFAKEFKRLYSQEVWVLIPGRQTEKGFQPYLFEDCGKTYAAFFSDGKEAQKHNGEILGTDIEKLILFVLDNEELSGIVIDPYTVEFYMEKRFIGQCLMYGEK